MNRPKGGLGRGLESLIPTGPSQSLNEVPIDSITPAANQPRQTMNPEALRELASSITEHGILQPLIVTRDGALAEDSFGSPRYSLIAGERRWQAAKLAGLNHVPVVIKDVGPAERLELALVENIQRADLTPLEEAEAYQQLVDGFDLTQEQVAAKVGKSRVAVANSLRLLNLSQPVKASLAQGRISEGHARALLGLAGSDEQVAVLKLVLEKGLNVRQVEELVRRQADRPVRRLSRAPSSPETRAVEERFREALGTRVQLFRSRKGGKLVIHFYSEEELQGVYDLIVREK